MTSSGQNVALYSNGSPCLSLFPWRVFNDFSQLLFKGLRDSELQAEALSGETRELRSRDRC